MARAQLVELLDAWVRPGEPWVVCGDFNVGPESAAIAAARERGLGDAYAGLPRAFTCNANRRAKRIDFLLHSSELVAVPMDLRPVEDETPLPSFEEPSDHLPIVAEVLARHA